MSEKQHNLNVYNEARRLYLTIKKSTQKVPRDERYNFIMPVLDKIEDIMATILIASKMKDKTETLNSAIQTVLKIQIKMKNLYELHMLTKKGFATITYHSESLFRQLTGWKNKNNDGEGAGRTPESE